MRTQTSSKALASIKNGFEPPGVLSDVFETPRARVGCKPTLATLVMIEPRVVTNGRNACVSLILRHQSKRNRRECMDSESDRSHGHGREKGCRVDAVIKHEKKSGTLAH